MAQDLAAIKLTTANLPGEPKSNSSTQLHIVGAFGENQTKYSIIAELDASGFFEVAETLFARSGRRQLEANLANLKDILEVEAAGDN